MLRSSWASHVVRCSRLEHLDGKEALPHSGMWTRWQSVGAANLSSLNLSLKESSPCCYSFSFQKFLSFLF